MSNTQGTPNDVHHLKIQVPPPLKKSTSLLPKDERGTTDLHSVHSRWPGPNMMHATPPVYEGGGTDNYAYETSEFPTHLQDPSTSRAVLNTAQHTTLATTNTIHTRRPSALQVALALNDDPHGYSFGADPYPDDSLTDTRSCCDKFRDVRDDVVETVKRGCTIKLLYKRVPIVKWLPKYTVADAVSDLIAGITVGLTILPQAIAFANVAGVPPQNGLYSSLFGGYITAILGSSRITTVGPTAMQSILTRSAVSSLDFAILLCFFSGLLQILMGLLQLGFIIDFISGPVSVGFTSAAAIVIISTQIKDLLGIIVVPGQFLELWYQIADQIGNTRLWDAVMGFGSIILLFLLKNINIIQVGPKEMHEKSTCQKIIFHLLWGISVTRNIIVVILTSVIAYLFLAAGSTPFKLTGKVKSGLPAFQPPPFTTVYQNKTYNFMEMASELSSSTFVLGIIAVVEDVAVARVFANGVPVDSTQEMLASGIIGVLSSFVGGVPITGSLSRGAVNAASGVKTTFGGIYTATIVVLALCFLTPYFYFIPKSALAAVICMAVYAMVEYEILLPIWKTKKIDLIPGLATFFCCLFISLQVGIIIGIGVNVLFLLYATARPKVSIEESKSISGLQYLLVTPDRALVFPSVEFVKNLVSKAGLKQGLSTMPVVLDSTHVQGIDYTTAKGVKQLMDDFNKRHQVIIFFNLKPSIIRSFKAVKPKDFRYCNTLQELDTILHDNIPKSQLALEKTKTK